MPARQGFTGMRTQTVVWSVGHPPRTPPPTQPLLPPALHATPDVRRACTASPLVVKAMQGGRCGSMLLVWRVSTPVFGASRCHCLGPMRTATVVPSCLGPSFLQLHRQRGSRLPQTPRTCCRQPTASRPASLVVLRECQQARGWVPFEPAFPRLLGGSGWTTPRR